MKRIIFVFIAFVFVMPSLAGAQQTKIWEIDKKVYKKSGTATLWMQRDNRSGARPLPGQFVAMVSAPGVSGVFNGVCGESLSVELGARFNKSDISAYRQSGSGSDLPIADALSVMKDALIEQCDQVQVIRVNFINVYDVTKDLATIFNSQDADISLTGEDNYQGTLTRAGNWRLEDGYVPTAYDRSHRFILSYRDTLTDGGVYHVGGCEDDPMLILNSYYTVRTLNLDSQRKPLNILQFISIAKKVAQRYTQECPQTSRIQFILKPMLVGYRCAGGNECFLVIEKKSASKEWEVDQSQFEYDLRDWSGPIEDANDMNEVMAAGEFRLINYDDQGFFAYYYELFLWAYSDHCQAHIKDRDEREFRRFVTKFDFFGAPYNTRQVGPTEKIVIERKYAAGFDKYYPINRSAAAKIYPLYNWRQIVEALSGNCMNDRIQTVYQNMYNYAHGKPAIKGKYKTDKKPRIYNVTGGSSAPLKAKMILDKRDAMFVPKLPTQALPPKVTREQRRQTLNTPPQPEPSSAPDQPQVASPSPAKNEPKKDAVEPQRREQAEQLEQQRAINKEIKKLRRQHNKEMTADSQAHRQQLQATRDKEELRTLKEAHLAKREAMTAELRRKIDQLRESQ